MRHSEPITRPEVGKVGSRLGSWKPAPVLGLPNLPNLPNLFLPRVHVHTRTCRCVGGWACLRACARPLTPTFTLGRLGRLGRGSSSAGFQLPNLLPTFLTLGKQGGGRG